ncbi:hypothetical protein F0L74_03440 [Chitinophaga agrisoli]|uniref:Secreted Zn-dependent protease n=1 Tax=Chitinophaga agrisoli TaxID=2607653 RepID=A0A5B2W3D6_9BACT|nr:hypothetical protein [Chitinophaga agrisoli]KAA2245026.1 hypothetical protein F0L74_03440 [Chitinophaga agrisoli]
MLPVAGLYGSPDPAINDTPCKPTFNDASPASVVKDTPIIKLVFTMDSRPDDPEADTLFYPARKLRWTDFRGTPSLRGPSAAVAFTSFAYEGRSRLQRDTLQITLTLQVFFIRSASWARAGIMDSYALGHEQLHFDITYLVAQRFKQRIRSLALTRDDYDSMIQYEYLEAFREMNRLQEEYDGETRNGVNAAAQQEWMTRVSRELEAVKALP